MCCKLLCVHIYEHGENLSSPPAFPYLDKTRTFPPEFCLHENAALTNDTREACREETRTLTLCNYASRLLVWWKLETAKLIQFSKRKCKGKKKICSKVNCYITSQ